MSCKSIFACFSIVLLLAIGGLAFAGDLCTEPVMTTTGLVRGMSEKGTATCAWLGVPFAAPPVGELRWKAPRPAREWEGVRDATEWGDKCINTGFWKILNSDPFGGESEDCLYLNIWRPARSGKFPVMFWIHGGGYDGGTASNSYYRGDRLSEFGDVVVVTINYRLNIFGFMAHPELRKEDENNSTGVYGSLDQVAALKWVSENIEAFGGDPENITIFGESAGGYSICTMLATPLAEGLFDRAILESGGCGAWHDLEKAYKEARSLAQELGCDPDDLECLRGLPAKKMMKLIKGGIFEGTSGFGPLVEGYFLPDAPIDLIRSGAYNKVPFIAGSNRDEFAFMSLFDSDLRKVKPSEYEEFLREDFKLSEEEVRELMELYPLSEFDNKPVNAIGRMRGADMMLACPTYQGLAAASGHQADTWLYRFDFDGYRFGGLVGSVHAMEIMLIFDTMDHYPQSIIYSRKRIKKARPLSDTMMSYWVNFAKTGDPNGPGLPEWPRYDKDREMIMVLDTEVCAESFPDADRCAFWEAHPRENIIDRRGEK